CIERCVSSAMEAAGPNADFLVLDNASSDRTWEILCSLRDRNPNSLTIVQNGCNTGFPAACNQGIRHAIARGSGCVVLLNQDAFAQPGWLDNLLSASLAHPEYGAIQSLVLLESESGGTRINTAGNPIHFLGFSWCGSLGDPIPVDNGETIQEVPVASGAALLITREAIERVGILDELYFLYHEDADLCWRIRMAGFRIGMAPRSRVAHRYNESTGAAKFCYSERNRLLFL